MLDLTRILESARKGDRQAAAESLPLVYDELRNLATTKMAPAGDRPFPGRVRLHGRDMEFGTGRQVDPGELREHPLQSRTHAEPAVGMGLQDVRQQKGRLAARSGHSSGVAVLFCDGGGRFLADGTSGIIWQALATRSGGEVADMP